MESKKEAQREMNASSNKPQATGKCPQVMVEWKKKKIAQVFVVLVGIHFGGVVIQEC